MALCAVFCLVLLYFAAETRARCRHTLVVQKGLRVNTHEAIYVNFHDCPGVVTIKPYLWSLPNKGNEHHAQAVSNHNHNRSPVNITVKAGSQFIENDERGNPVFEAELEIKYCFGQDCGEPWTEIPSVKILLNSTHGYAIMATDRPAYRPGEKVRLAVALANQYLKPDTEKRSLKIFIKTPEEDGKGKMKGKIIVHDSADLNVKADGFLDYEYTIPSNPMKGIWWAETHVDGIKMAEKSFVIDRYQLPTFQVRIIPSYRFVLETMSHLEGIIEAEYSYGEKVNGYYYMTFSLIRDDGSETLFHKIPARFGDEASISRGREEYRVPVADLQGILRDDESIRELADTNARIVITASVTGLTESVFESDVVEDIIFSKSPFEIDYSQSPKFFIAGKVYALKATIKDAQSHLPLPDIPVRVEWGQNRSEDVISDKNGDIDQLIDVFQGDMETIVITTNSQDFPESEAFRARFHVHKYLPSRILGLRVKKQVVDVGNTQDVLFDIGNSKPTTIRFFVVARGQFVYAGTKELEVGQEEVFSSFRVDWSMIPNARIIAYYILDGELTSNSAWFDVTKGCETELKITSNADTVEPGSSINLSLTGSPDAKVLLMAVDRAAYFVHNGTRVTRQQLWSKMEAYDTGCSRKGGLTATNVFEEAGLSFNSPLTLGRIYTEMYCGNTRIRRNTPQTVEQARATLAERCGRDGQRVDWRGYNCTKRAQMIREASKNKHLSDDLLDACVDSFSRKCNSRRARSSLGRAQADAKAKAEEVRVRKRENFEESWIFQLRSLSGDGTGSIVTNAQDSISIYDVDAFGMSDDSPMCVAETKSIKVFVNVFIQMYLPYSLKVLEQASIRYSVFNYDDRDREVDISIRLSEDLCSRFRAGNDFKFVTSLTVRGKSAQSSTFTILPLRAPKNPATIEMKANNFDHIQREILIEHEGYRNESSKTIVLEAMEDGSARERTIIFDIPGTSVMPKTKHCSLYAYAHPMGPSVEINPFDTKLQNMDSYIRQPTGCGEQIMMTVGPIVYIQKYRVEVYGDAITAQQHSQVVAHIQSGFNSELGHLTQQANYRAFAVYNDEPPSTWLNAFVAKVFAAAREFWPEMDTEPLCTALEWLVTEKQNREGSFREDYPVHAAAYMRGSVEDSISLSAYVSITLNEAASMCLDHSSQLIESANRAIRYLKAHEQAATGNPYTLAMGAYALATSEPGSGDSERWNRMLMDLARNDEEYVFWKGNRGRASDIETTAYALLAEVTLHKINPDNDKFTRNIAHWLIWQRNAQGGFISTQDTVVALQALSAYMELLETSVTLAPPPTNLRVGISTYDPDHPLNNPVEVNLTSENTMRKKEISIDGGLLANVGGVIVSVSGVGTGSLAYRCTWRQFNDDGHCNFAVNVEMTDNGENGKILKVLVHKPDPPAAAMSIIDVGILSGFEPDEESIKKLVEVVDPSADRYEITNNTVKFYISGIGNDAVRLAFNIKQVAHVSKPQPATVSAYDYYEPDIRCTKFYSVDGDHRLQTSHCERSDDEMCRCAEGVCPICRTRQQQLTATNCSYHERDAKNLCVQQKLCLGDDCYNLHRKTCDSAYLYVATVTEVGEDVSGFKYFLANITEVIRVSERHVNPHANVVKFMMRKDCFAACRDERLNDIARTKHREAKHYISVGRTLMIYGSHPSFDKQENRFVYYLEEGAGVEITITTAKCNTLSNCNGRKKKKCRNREEKMNICRIKSVLNRAHQYGCD